MGGTEIVNVDLANEHFLKYPEGSSAYPNNANRGWVFYSTDPKYVVHIQFTQLDVELSATGCDFDYIEVFDSSAEEKKLDRLCGFMTRPQYYSTGEFLYLTFHSNGFNVGTGFNLTYTAALQAVIYPEPVCSPSLLLAAVLHDNKFLRYPALTSASRNNNDCGWTIQSGSVDYILHVTFLSVDIRMSGECRNDHVEVYDGSPMESNILGAICGNHSQQEFYSSGQSLFIKFQTSYFTTGNFHLSYEAVLPSEVSRKTDCSYSILLSGSPQQFYFRYPENNINYNNNLDCVWLFKTDSSNYVVHVNFTFVDTEYIANCSYDYIAIFDGTPPQATVLWKLCGQLGQQREFYSTGQSLYIVFHSDPAVTGQGFRLTYTSALRSEVPQDSYGVCVQVHVQAATYSNKNLRYPYLPVNYVNNADCYWLLQTSLLGYVVSVTFTFVDIEYSNGCPYDYVQLFDGSSTFADSLGKVCRLTSETFYSSGPSMYIRFHSDDTTTKRGFQLTYRAVSRLNIPTAPATTPFVEELSLTAWDYAEQYLQYPTASAKLPQQRRPWLAHQTSDFDIGYTVHVTFTFVDTEYSSDCVNDYIEVFDGPSGLTGSLGKLCGSTVRDFYGTWSSMYIRFHSNGAVTRKGL
ncbi:dorsal-ventral patterning tolloid-like protein 1 [Pomacea canaliculata]|uniref:dorsal-ventral patterning tolloid-like protein 1 n=1 Tax=Pomacea canaliculata TaxID=400727 RepID=UPI000D7315E9|nr:dorsal-ventral patterning tolloid-like protein 1 [Pomacea canaliculata]